MISEKCWLHVVWQEVNGGKDHLCSVHPEIEWRQGRLFNLGGFVASYRKVHLLCKALNIFILFCFNKSDGTGKSGSGIQCGNWQPWHLAKHWRERCLIGWKPPGESGAADWWAYRNERDGLRLCRVWEIETRQRLFVSHIEPRQEKTEKQHQTYVNVVCVNVVWVGVSQQRVELHSVSIIWGR